jgi:hypothetical protein
MILALYSPGVSAIGFLPGRVIHRWAQLSSYWSWRWNPRHVAFTREARPHS